MIDFKEGAVCYAYGRQWSVGDKVSTMRDLKSITINDFCNLKEAVDFQLNEPREGYYIPKSELDTEEKYNQAVEVFGLCGFARDGQFALRYRGFSEHKLETALVCCDGELMGIQVNHEECKVKLTFDQLMAIGELKRKMNERDCYNLDPRSTARPKSREAYRILESMGIEWDNVEGKWFKVSKEWL